VAGAAKLVSGRVRPKGCQSRWGATPLPDANGAGLVLVPTLPPPHSLKADGIVEWDSTEPTVH
jgi:hypothetical protein